MFSFQDNVDSNCKAYILSGFIKTMERIHWKKTDPLYYTTLLRTLDLLAEMTQENYAHHLDTGTNLAPSARTVIKLSIQLLQVYLQNSAYFPFNTTCDTQCDSSGNLNLIFY